MLQVRHVLDCSSISQNNNYLFGARQLPIEGPFLKGDRNSSEGQAIYISMKRGSQYYRDCIWANDISLEILSIRCVVLACANNMKAGESALNAGKCAFDISNMVAITQWWQPSLISSNPSSSNWKRLRAIIWLTRQPSFWAIICFLRYVNTRIVMRVMRHSQPIWHGEVKENISW